MTARFYIFAIIYKKLQLATRPDYILPWAVEIIRQLKKEADCSASFLTS